MERDDLILEGIAHIHPTPAAKIAIIGPDGIGKTSLVLSLLHDPKVKAHLAGACYFVSCEALCMGTNLVRGILEALRISVHPEEKETFGFLYQQLLKAGNLFLVLDNLETLWSEDANADATGVDEDLQRALEILGSVYTITLVVTRSGAVVPACIPWTMLLREGGIRPLAPHDIIALLQHNVRQSFPTESIDDEQAMELAKAVNGVPLAIKLVSGIYNPKHRDTFAFLSQLKERISSPGDGVPNIIQIIVEIALDSAPISENPECPGLLSILSFLPEGVPHYKSILHQLTPHFLDVDAAASILLQTCLAQETSAGALTLLPSIGGLLARVDLSMRT